MMKDKTLIAEWFPAGVVMRLAFRDGAFRVRWLYQARKYEVSAPTLEAAVTEAVQAVNALEQTGGPV